MFTALARRALAGASNTLLRGMCWRTLCTPSLCGLITMVAVLGEMRGGGNRHVGIHLAKGGQRECRFGAWCLKRKPTKTQEFQALLARGADFASPRMHAPFFSSCSFLLSPPLSRKRGKATLQHRSTTHTALNAKIGIWEYSTSGYIRNV